MSRWLVSVATPDYSGQLCYRLSLHDTLDQLVVNIVTALLASSQASSVEPSPPIHGVRSASLSTFSVKASILSIIRVVCSLCFSPTQ